VLYSEPDYVIVPNVEPNDEFWSDQWNMHMTHGIRAPAAWDIWTGEQSPELLVAVVDNGVAYTHPDLAPNMWTNPGEILGNGVDDDGNGYIDDVHGYDFTGSDDSDPFPFPTPNDSSDRPGHGTHVAGILAATANNTTGVAGAVWRARIVAVKFYNKDGFVSDALEALDYVIDNNIRISNNSWEVIPTSDALYLKIQAMRSIGHLFITSAGNDSDDLELFPQYPAAYDLENIITVAYSTNQSELASGSNYGALSVDLAAPGASIKSTYWLDTPPPDGTLTYGNLTGTSMAAPHVAGVAALVWGQNPGLTWQQVKGRILNTVRPNITLQYKTVSGGIVDAAGALLDCNLNGISDTIDIMPGGGSANCDGNKVPDECQFDCDEDGVPDVCEEIPGARCELLTGNCIPNITECVCHNPQGFYGAYAGPYSTCGPTTCWILPNFADPGE